MLLEDIFLSLTFSLDKSLYIHVGLSHLDSFYSNEFIPSTSLPEWVWAPPPLLPDCCWFGALHWWATHGISRTQSVASPVWKPTWHFPHLPILLRRGPWFVTRREVFSTRSSEKDLRSTPQKPPVLFFQKMRQVAEPSTFSLTNKLMVSGLENFLGSHPGTEFCFPPITFSRLTPLTVLCVSILTPS